MSATVDGAVPSPNIWHHPDLYEIENAAVDPDRVIEATMQSFRPWDGATLLDIGCGTGFHLARFAAQAAHVVGVEPHLELAARARRRVLGSPRIDVLAGSAQRLPVADTSIDVAHARWSYFFGPGCEPGLRELDRVMRRGGVAFIIDNDSSRSTFGQWFRRALPSHEQAAIDAFFGRHGWESRDRDICWGFKSRRDLESVVRIEFSPDLADAFLAEHEGTYVDYAIMVRVRRY